MVRNNYLVMILILIIVLILVDVIFNFSGLLQENFRIDEQSLGQTAFDEIDTEDTDTDSDEEIKSIISKSGISNNVSKLGSSFIIRKDNINVYEINVENNQLLETIQNNTKSTQRFYIKKMNNIDDVKTFIGESSHLIRYSDITDFPYHFIESIDKKGFVLSDSNNGLTLIRCNNNSKQRFTLSNDKVQHPAVTEKSECIDLNIDVDDLVDSIIDRVTPYEAFSNYDNCDRDKWIPRSAVKSLCNGCDPNLIENN
jgi:hypothetical protein